MQDYVLSLNINKDDFHGAFVDYSNQVAPMTNRNPSGRAWWQSVRDTGAWTVVPAGPGAPPNRDGDPRYASPMLHDGDTIAFQVLDPNPNDPKRKVTNVQFAVVFGRTRNAQGQLRAAKASPFQRAATVNGQVRTTFIGPAINLGPDLWKYTLPDALYPVANSVGPNTKADFSCYVGALVTFADGTENQYGLDPEMDVEDYGGGNK